MIGAIILWSGLVSNIPNHWQLCDGTNGTPDLRAKFLKGATNDGDVHDAGGTVNHNHPFTGDGHYHTRITGPGVQGGDGFVPYTDTDYAVGTTDNTDGQPPFYKLAYIQRMSL